MTLVNKPQMKYVIRAKKNWKKKLKNNDRAKQLISV